MCTHEAHRRAAAHGARRRAGLRRGEEPLRGPRRGRVGVGRVGPHAAEPRRGDEARRDPGLLRRVLRRLRRARARVPGERPDLRLRDALRVRGGAARPLRVARHPGRPAAGACLREPAALPLPRARGRRRRLCGRRLRGAARRRRERDGVERRRRRGPDGRRAAPRVVPWRRAGRAADARRRRAGGRATGGQSQFHVPRRRDTGDGPRRSRARRQVPRARAGPAGRPKTAAGSTTRAAAAAAGSSSQGRHRGRARLVVHNSKVIFLSHPPLRLFLNSSGSTGSRAGGPAP